jgi:Xaa-Pro aminopeptidase
MERATLGRSRTVVLTLIVIGLCATGVRADDLSDDLAARRARLMERLGPDTMLVMLSAPTRTYSLDVDYEYRQDSNLYYLTGLAQEDTALVLMPGNATRRELLFVMDRNPSDEHRSGRVLSHGEAAARTGIHTVLSHSRFEPFLGAMFSRVGFESSIDAAEAGHFFAALAEGRARLAVVLDKPAVKAPLSPIQEFVRRLRDRYAGFQPIDATPLLADLRLVKTPLEQKNLVRATEISSEAQMAGMRAARPGVYEYEVKAAIEAVHRARGAVSWAYPSIVGSGPNATILHYPDSNRQMLAGDLLLVDAACNFQYMSPDITRTYPVSGTFSPVQRDIYSLVLRAQEEGMTVARAGSSLAAIHNKVVEVFKEGLLRLGLITDTSGEQYRMWFTHGSTHYIGIDVHDVGEGTRPLKPGMSFVIEPGLYIRQSALDALPRTPANLALIERVQPAVTKYAGIGVRVEDSFLLEASGLRRLSSSVPRTIEEVEAFLRARGAAPSTGAR